MHFGDCGVIHQSDPGVSTDLQLWAMVGCGGWGLERTFPKKIARLRVLGRELSSSCGSLGRKWAGPQGASLEKVNCFLLKLEAKPWDIILPSERWGACRREINVSASCPAIQLMIFASMYLKLRWEIDCIQRQNEVGEAHLRLPKDSADTRKHQRDHVWGPQPEYPRG